VFSKHNFNQIGLNF